MKTHILQETNWESVKNSLYNVAILPWGATEAHNLHLAYGTDTILAEKIAADAAEIANREGAGAIVLPSIAYGVNSGQMEIPLCMHMNPTTQLSILRDILYVLDNHEIRRFIIINGHGGNAFQPIIRELSLEFPDILMSYVNWWTVEKADKYFGEPGDHAGELETSAMMHIRPELVAPLGLEAAEEVLQRAVALVAPLVLHPQAQREARGLDLAQVGTVGQRVQQGIADLTAEDDE